MRNGFNRSKRRSRTPLVERLEQRQLMSITSATLTGTNFIIEGQTASFTVQNYTTNPSGDSVQWALKFPDGYTTPQGNGAGMSEISKEETQDGSVVTLTGYDLSDGTQFTMSQSFKVNDASFGVTGFGISFVPNYETGGIMGTITDSNPYGNASDFTVQIDYGDGTTGTGDVEMDANQPDPAHEIVFDFFGDHTWNQNQQYPLGYKVTDIGNPSHPVTASAVAAPTGYKLATDHPNSATEGWWRPGGLPANIDVFAVPKYPSGYTVSASGVPPTYSLVPVAGSSDPTVFTLTKTTPNAPKAAFIDVTFTATPPAGGKPIDPITVRISPPQ